MSIWKRARDLFEGKTGNVNLISRTSNLILFHVKLADKIYEIIFDRRLERWRCTCRWYSVKGTDCSHIIACKAYLRRKSNG